MEEYMVDKNRKLGLSNVHSIQDVEVGAKSQAQAKTRLSVTVLPKTSNWLKGQGNASHAIDELVEAAIAGNLQPTEHSSQKLEELTRENEELKAALSQLQERLEKESESPQDYQVIRDKVLNALKLGRQAPGYRSALKALDRFIAEIQ